MKTIVLLTSLFCLTYSYAQVAKSIHQEELEKYNALGNSNASFYESQVNEAMVSMPKMNCNLNKVVYGWHPYWSGSAYQNYQWDLLSHFSFFSYEVDAATGNSLNSHGWSTSAAVDAALASGNTKVTLCVTLFSGHTTFFGSPAAQQTLITNLINLVQSRGAHGVNIDFEGIPSSQTTNFANFMVNLANQMHSAIPGSEVSTVLYAVDWNNVFDFSIMEPEVDQYIIMGYGYYYNGSSNAGPTDPLYHFGSSYNYTLSKTITTYLDNGCPANKLVMGLPSYGYEWETSSSTIVSPTTASGTARTYAYVKNNTSGNYSTANHQWVADPQSDAYVFNNGVNNQCFISLDSAWRKRLDHINKTGIAGIGIWALGYDNGYTGLWSAMNDYLTDCYEDPCSGTIHDFGGPTRNYYNNEDYTWTISPPNATSIEVNFTDFDVELNWDYLYIFDGPSDQSPQIAGSPFTGTNGPGQFTTSGGDVTFRFYSDGATVKPGFNATYQCAIQPAPEAQFSIDDLVICLGDSIQLVNNTTDGETYYWTTSAGGLSSATAEEPYLFPSSSTNYQITLTASNGSGSSQITQQFAIEVMSPPIAIGSVSETTVGVGGAVTFSNSSVNADDYLWEFGDGQISTDSEPWHIYDSPGTYTVLLIAMNAGCESDTSIIEISISAAGIVEHNWPVIEIYPNPNNGRFTLKNLKAEEDLFISDQSGRVIEKFKFHSNLVELDLNYLASGIYTITQSGLNKRLVIKN